MTDIAAIRRDYRLQTLSEADASANPFEQFMGWWADAVNSQIDEVNAFTLATASSDGKPSARIVLLKGYDEKGFVFFTNYNSKKGEQLLQNPAAAIVFFWKELERQVRIEGAIEKVSATENDEYFNSRPEGSRIGAWASPQSQVISSRSVIEFNASDYEKQFEGNIPRPPHWGGYRLVPDKFEFWQGRSSRLHDRLQYQLKDGDWTLERLAP